mmetsp:Transcript_3655/g.8150  ORF Transcript_3655/g.8150 Transcript_3655/m.8150 type:complete len:389 (-) Transcript_3655:360-1526(-)
MSNDGKFITIARPIRVLVHFDGLLCAGFVKFEDDKVKGWGECVIIVIGMLNRLHNVALFTVILIIGVEDSNANCFGCEWDIAMSSRENKIIMDEASSTSHPVDKERILVAAIPKHGPTALQVAIRVGASVNAIVALLKACPFALIVSTKTVGEDSTEEDCGGDDKVLPDDPLSLAKQFRGDEEDLMAHLSKPLSYWLAESQKEQIKRDQLLKLKADEGLSQRCKTPIVFKGTDRHPLLVQSDKVEMDSIKVIASTLLKGQKRQAQALEVHKHEMEEELATRPSFPEMEARQKQWMQTQMVALDMKERAMRHKNREMERRMIDTFARAQQDNRERMERQQQALSRLEYNVMEDFRGMLRTWKRRPKRNYACWRRNWNKSVMSMRFFGMM